MSVLVRCPNPECGRSAALPANFAGRSVRCPHCRATFQLPTPMAGAVHTEADQTGSSVSSTIGFPEAPGPAGASATAAPAVPSRIGRYVLRGRLGAGAFGTVYRAHDPQLDREVALKVPQEGALDSPQRVERFLREAKAAARLHHPNIVPVYDAGCDGGHYFIAAAFIEGRTLAQVNAEAPLDFRAAARLACELAEALAYVHALGVVHRDVKPANVLVDKKGRPFLTDFGLAHLQDVSGALTRLGTVLGTPTYMAPEQAAGRGAAVPPASDQYSLGAMLYEILCGRPPFEGPPQVILFNVLHRPPPPPRQVNSAVPAGLEAICLRAMARRPQDRYAGCQELADALRAWLGSGAAALASPLWAVQAASERTRTANPEAEGRLLRWCREKPGQLLLALLGLLACVVLGVVLLLPGPPSPAEVPPPTREEDAGRRARAEQADRKKALDRCRAVMAEGDKAMRDRRFPQALAKYDEGIEALTTDPLLATAPERPALLATVERAKALAARRQEIHGTTFAARPAPLAGHANYVYAVAFSPDGKRLVSTGADGTVRLWDAATGQARGALQGYTGHVCAVAFSPDGKRVAGAGSDKGVRVWDADTGAVALTFTGHDDYVSSVAFNRDGTRLASASDDGTVRVWNTVTGKPALVLKEHAGPVYGVAFSPDGKRLASGGADRLVRLWDAQTGAARGSLKGYAASVSAVVFSPDGKRVAAAGYDKTVRVWEVDTLNQALSLGGHTGAVCCVAFSRDGRRIATGGYDKTIAIWDAETGERTRTLRDHTAAVRGVAFAPDGGRLASASLDGTVRLWDARPVRLP